MEEGCDPHRKEWCLTVVVPVAVPCKGALELPTPKPMVFRVEYLRTKLDSKAGITYEKGAPDAFWIEGIVGKVVEGIEPLAKVVGI
jgi:hypothetical protein